MSGVRSAGTEQGLHRRRRRVWVEGGVGGVLLFCALLSIALILGVTAVLGNGVLQFLREVPLTQFVFGQEWSPFLEPRSFGVLPLFAGSLVVLVLSLVLAVPIGFATALYLSEYADSRTSLILRSVLDLLSAMPSVVFGWFALVTLSPTLRTMFPHAEAQNMLSAAIAIALMILPTISVLAHDALRAVPRSLREAALALGATRLEVTTEIVVPRARPALGGAVLFAASRVLGEAVIVTLAAGAVARFSLNPLEGVLTLTSFVLHATSGDMPGDPVASRAVFAVAGLLVVLTAGLHHLGHRLFLRRTGAW